MTPPDSDGLEQLGLTVPDHVVTSVLVGQRVVGLPVPGLTADDHVLNIGSHGYHVTYPWSRLYDVLG